MRLAEEIARRAAVRIDNARLYEERDHTAKVLQRSLLPPSLPAIPYVELAARYLPVGEGNEVGGDFYDVFDCGDGNWAAAVGDVCGKGPEAAAVMGLARHTLRAVAGFEDKPSALLRELNRALIEQSVEERFCTVCHLRLRPSREHLRSRCAPRGTLSPCSCGGTGTCPRWGNRASSSVFPEVSLVDTVVDLGSRRHLADLHGRRHRTAPRGRRRRGKTGATLSPQHSAGTPKRPPRVWKRLSVPPADRPHNAMTWPCWSSGHRSWVRFCRAAIHWGYSLNRVHWSRPAGTPRGASAPRLRTEAPPRSAVLGRE